MRREKCTETCCVVYPSIMRCPAGIPSASFCKVPHQGWRAESKRDVSYTGSVFHSCAAFVSVLCALLQDFVWGGPQAKCTIAMHALTPEYSIYGALDIELNEFGMLT